MRNLLRIAAVCLLASGFPVRAAAGPVSFKLPGGMAIRIVEAPFVASRHRIKSCRGRADVCLVDGRVPFGTTGGMPKTYVKSISASIQGRRYELDASQMFDAWGGRPVEAKLPDGTRFRYFGGRCADAVNCTFRGLFSDGAGTFVAEWKIVDGTPQRTVLSWSDDVVKLFMDDIDSPGIE
jgi:hypothetical protein